MSKAKIRVIDDICKRYKWLVEAGQKNDLDHTCLFFEEEEHELLYELGQFHSKASKYSTVNTADHLDDWSSALAPCEVKNYEQYLRKWEDKFGRSAAEDERAVFALSQDRLYVPSPENTLTQGSNMMSRTPAPMI